ncbi:nectin-4-like [Saccoglossus kowalevskii]|uniref:Poliovirus receptor-related protein 4-like n=1 Tax=Saccoglossus kowalevskii TaxID=10224 RepID=A0ABM0MI14_SACKO|nr:PREDICTED: poliovirus receptor-related protein 4-like [Saccoglossus kowalevskii]
MAFHLAFGVYVIAFIEAILLYGESSAALAKESQTAIAGDASVHLPCYYDKPAGSVDVGNVWLQWRNEELILLELKLFSSSLASYLSVEKYSVDDDGRMVIHNVTIEDEGKYLCLVNWDMKDYYITQQTEVNLRVLSPKREVYLHLEPSGKRQNVTHGTAIQLDQSKDHVIECSAANDDRETQLVWDVQPSILNTVIVYGEEDIKTSRLIILADNETGIITCTCSLNRPPLPPMTTSITVELIKPSEKKTKKNTENRRDRKKRRRRPADSSHPKRRRKPANLHHRMSPFTL